jgi:hypothetical protein
MEIIFIHREYLPYVPHGSTLYLQNKTTVKASKEISFLHKKISIKPNGHDKIKNKKFKKEMFAQLSLS